MKKIKYLLSILFIVPIMFLFVGCNDNNNTTPEPTQLTAEHIVLATTDYYYSGSAITPAVTVKVGDNVINESEYTVEYANNIDVGTASLTVTAKSESTVLKGTASKNFNILDRVSHVSTLEQLTEELAYETNTIILDNDINYNSDSDFVYEILVSSHGLNVTIDLNGHTFKPGLRITNMIEGANEEYESGDITYRDMFYRFPIEITIRNGNFGTDEIQNEDYSGLYLACNGDVVTATIILENVNMTCYHNCVSTDIMGDSVMLIADSCSFKTTCDNENSVPLKMDAQYMCSFVNCNFEGYRCLELGKGWVSFDDGCTGTATGDALVYIESNYETEQQYNDDISSYISFIINPGKFTCTLENAVIVREAKNESLPTPKENIYINIAGSVLILNTDKSKTDYNTYVDLADENILYGFRNCRSTDEPASESNTISEYTPTVEEVD